MLYAKTGGAGGLVIPFHTLENGAACDREIPRDKPLAVMLHYTACPDLPRTLPLSTTAKYIDRARVAKKVFDDEARAAVQAAAALNLPPGDGVPDAIAQAAVAAYSPREACAHYYVASCRHGDIVHPGEIPVVEFVSPDRVAHHCGPLTGWWNRHTVGIEVCYPGPVPRKDGKTEASAREWYERRAWYTPPAWSREKCSDGVSRWFAPIGDALFWVIEGLIADLCLAYPTICHLVSHSYVAPSKRIDPDPPLSLPRIAHNVQVLMGRQLRVNVLKR